MKTLALFFTTVLVTVFSLHAATEKELIPFRQLQPAMGVSDVIKICGEPTKDVGSGIYIFVYNFSDGTSVIVGCAEHNIHSVKYGFIKPLQKQQTLTELLQFIPKTKAEQGAAANP